MISGIHNSMESLHLLSNAKSRSVSAENLTGAKGEGGKATQGMGKTASRELGPGWKVSPSICLPSQTITLLADLKTSGAIQHIWMTGGQTHGKEVWRDCILRIYWDDAPFPSVEVPMGDFFANGWNVFSPVSSLAVCVNPARGFNCYWTMPFRKRARITMENRNPEDLTLYYQIDYSEAPVEEDSAYFCAAFRRSNPTKDGIHTLLNGVKGKGQYVGTYLAWQVNNNGWWGEGEIKFYLDGDETYPTICGTGTEDYFGGAYNFDVPGKGYLSYSTPYSGFSVLRPDGLYQANTRFSMYRWHISDPIRFEKDLRVTIQDLGWRSEGRYLVQKSDIASVSFWYQTFPMQPLQTLPSRNELEII